MPVSPPRICLPPININGSNVQASREEKTIVTAAYVFLSEDFLYAHFQVKTFAGTELACPCPPAFFVPLAFVLVVHLLLSILLYFKSYILKINGPINQVRV